MTETTTPTDGFDAWAAAQGEPTTRHQDGAEVVTHLPAFRIAAGQAVTIDRRRYVVTHVQLVAFYSRNRNTELAPSQRTGYRLTLRHARGGHRVETFRQTDLVRVAK